MPCVHLEFIAAQQSHLFVSDSTMSFGESQNNATKDEKVAKWINQSNRAKSADDEWCGRECAWNEEPSRPSCRYCVSIFDVKRGASIDSLGASIEQATVSQLAEIYMGTSSTNCLDSTEHFEARDRVIKHMASYIGGDNGCSGARMLQPPHAFVSPFGTSQL